MERCICSGCEVAMLRVAYGTIYASGIEAGGSGACVCGTEVVCVGAVAGVGDAGAHVGVAGSGGFGGSGGVCCFITRSKASFE